MGRLGDGTVVGFGGGSVEVLGEGPSPASAAVPLEGTPASAPISAAAGPGRTVAVGFRNGVVGLWSVEDGSRLYRFRLHGPVRFLAVQGTFLQAVTELGDRRSLDLEILGYEGCRVLRHLWREVTVEWHEGAPRRRAPPAGHRCAGAR